MMTGSGAGMSGSGLGSVLLAGAKQLAMPLAKRALKSAGRAAVREGSRAALGLAGDALLGRNLKKTVKTRGVRALKRAGVHTLRETLGPYAKRSRTIRETLGPYAKRPRRRAAPIRRRRKPARKRTKTTQRGKGGRSRNVSAFVRAMALGRARAKGRRKRGQMRW